MPNKNVEKRESSRCGLETCADRPGVVTWRQTCGGTAIFYPRGLLRQTLLQFREDCVLFSVHQHFRMRAVAKRELDLTGRVRIQD